MRIRKQKERKQMPSTALSKTYRPEEHEPRIWQRWVESRVFHADPKRVLDGQARPYCVLIPPPNVTAALHLGHALNNSLQDVLVRAYRMKGFETVWLPGTDHAGIATQTVVEKRVLAEEGKRRTDFERAEFVEKIQAFKDEYEQRITEQLQAMGCSCDWDRQRFTMDALCRRAVREAFFRLFREGLIYRGKRLVNWDPVTRTALADDEVENIEIDGAFYFLRYPLVHRPTNADDPHDAQEVTWSELASRGYPGAEAMPDEEVAWLTVATTRPETYLGDTGVAINPKDPRAAALRGLFVQLPLVGRIIPIVEDDYVVSPARYPWESEQQAAERLGDEPVDPKAAFATGFLKVTPAHDPNDWEIGLRHNLEPINVMAPDGTISDEYGWKRSERGEGGKIFLGKNTDEARELVVKEFKARNLLEEVRPYRHSVGHSYRSHAPIEPYLSDQWYVKVTDDRLRGQAQRALNPDQRTQSSLAAWPESRPEAGNAGSLEAGDGALSFYPPRYARTYESWHDNLRDWCISRQLWWGHRIPVWTKTIEPGAACDLGFVDRAADRACGRQRMTDDGQRVVEVAVGPGAESVEAALEAAGFVRDPDVLDTWFSSALWPMSTMGWPADDLPLITAAQIDPVDPGLIQSVFVKRVGSWRELIGTQGEPSAELIERLLHLRDSACTNSGRVEVVYQLFSESTLPDGAALTSPDDIASCEDLVCAVGVRTSEPVATDKYGLIEVKRWLEGEGFVDTAGMLAAFNPTSVLCTAREIITLWVSRMVMFNRHFLADGSTPGPVPFGDVFIHAMIQDGQGRKMSKSLGNGVDPLDIIHSHGADAMRFTLVQMTTQTQDVRMPVVKDEKTGRNTSPKFDAGRNFCNKLWNAARFALGNLPGAGASAAADGGAIDPALLGLADRWMLSRLAQAIDAIDAALSEYQFSAYAQTAYDLLWRDFCDWYLEAIKPTVRTSAAGQACLCAVLDAIIRLLHPIVPFITEAIGEQVATRSCAPIAGLVLEKRGPGEPLAAAGWPEHTGRLVDEAAASRFESIRTLVTAIREVRARHKVAPRRTITLHVDDALAELIGADRTLVMTLAGLGLLTDKKPGASSAAFTFDGREYRVSDLADAVDASAERERLGKQRDELTRSIAALTGRLNNPGYVDKAPAHLVEATRSQLEAARADLAALEAALGALE